MALPTDVGLYLDFNITDDGTPVGCPGGFGRFVDAKCGVNMYEEPAGSKPLYQVVEEYADDQNAWIEDFIPTMEKMMSNGYGENDLIDSNYDYSKLSCLGATRNGFTKCFYKSENDGEVRLNDGKYPEVFLHGTWSPICPHFFWDNNHGATLFCQKLNPEFKSGTVIRRYDKPLGSDGIRIGKCFSSDNWLECSGGCNDIEIGGHCYNAAGAKCEAGSAPSIEIHCGQGIFHTLIQKYLYIRNFTKNISFIDCDCDPQGTTQATCDTETGQCLCKEGFGGPRCDQCSPGYFKSKYLPFIRHQPCECNEEGSTSNVCNCESGQCPCKENITGRSPDLIKVLNRI